MARTSQTALKSTGAPAKRVKLILPKPPIKKKTPLVATSSPKVEEHDVVSITSLFFLFIINDKI
jgi:hypothetical protein